MLRILVREHAKLILGGLPNLGLLAKGNSLFLFMYSLCVMCSDLIEKC